MHKIYSHPRSGTNLARQTVGEVFYPDTDLERDEPVMTGHWADRVMIPAEPAWGLRGGHMFWDEHEGIYVVRDGRDVAASFYRTKGFQHPSWRDLSFAEYIRKPLDWYETPGHPRQPEMTLIEHWYEHTMSWYKRDGVYYLRYERLLTDPEDEIVNLSDWLGIEPQGDASFAPAGPYPAEKFDVGKWHDVFDEDDLAYFFSIVPEDYWALWV